MSATPVPSGSVIERLPFEQYVDMPEVHATGLRDLAVSPLLYHWRQTSKRPDTDRLRIGRACHTAVLEPDRFLLEYTVWRGGVRRSKKWDAFKEANSDKTILTMPQYDQALRVRDAVRSHAVAKRLIEQGRTELTLKWQHVRTGLACKARLDHLGLALSDLKTCRNPDPRKFSADAARYGYAMQLAFYADGCAQVLGELPPVKIIAAQNTAPYDVAVFDLDEDVLGHGRAETERLIDLLVECKRANHWPGIAPEEVALKLPLWAARDYEESAPDNDQPIEDAEF
jgi:PDDEXK-like domain of unknown function (DUF3799)